MNELEYVNKHVLQQSFIIVNYSAVLFTASQHSIENE